MSHLSALLACSLLTLPPSPSSWAKCTEVEQIATGFRYAEGPVIDGAGNLFFTDNRTGWGRIYRLDPTGKLTLHIANSGYANGLALPPDGELIACSTAGKILAFGGVGNCRVVADSYQGNRFNAPNDLTLDRLGGLYFTDPAFFAPLPLPQQVRAVYHVSAQGVVTRVTGDLANPNGIHLSRDGRTLFVVQSFHKNVLAYPVLAPGLLGEPRVFCQIQPSWNIVYPGGDGLTEDARGNLFITAQSGVQIFDRHGQFLHMIRVPERPANVAFGGPDGKTLYITARHSIYSIRIP